MNFETQSSLQNKIQWKYADSFQKKDYSSNNLWGLILAGGEGKRLLPFISKLYGVERPKQFCSIVGKRSMLQHTLDRAKLLIPQHQILTIVNQHHLKYVNEQLYCQQAENIIVQPYARETANGILLPLLHLYRRDPNAYVSIFPSDQFILEENRFMGYVEQAYSFVRHKHGSIVLLGIVPSNFESGYGWIEKGETVNNVGSIYRVNKFLEKPCQSDMDPLRHKNWLWNSFVMIGNVGTLLSLFKEVIPKVFDQLNSVMMFDGPLHNAILNRVFATLPSHNFSKIILERFAERLCVMPVTNTYWSDWGDSHRILNDVERLKLKMYNRIKKEETKYPITTSSFVT